MADDQSAKFPLQSDEITGPWVGVWGRGVGAGDPNCRTKEVKRVQSEPATVPYPLFVPDRQDAPARYAAVRPIQASR